MGKRLEIDALRTLKAVHDLGGVSRAAEFLSLSQSAVSHKIKRLEQNIDCQLLRRKPGQSLLTEDGQHLVTYAERMIAIHDEALAGIDRPLLKGRIRLGITEEMVTTGLARALGRFVRLFPNVHVKTRVEQSLILNEKLNKAAIDMAVLQVFTHELQHGEKPLREDRLVWVKSRDYETPPAGRIPFIAFDQNCFYRKWATSKFLEANQQLDVVLECASNAGVCSAVSAGMGIALIEGRHVQSDMEIIDIGFAKPPDISFVVRMSSDKPMPHLMALRNEIGRSFSR